MDLLTILSQFETTGPFSWLIQTNKDSATTTIPSSFVVNDKLGMVGMESWFRLPCGFTELSAAKPQVLDFIVSRVLNHSLVLCANQD